jgi:hypothetical protein
MNEACKARIQTMLQEMSVPDKYDFVGDLLSDSYQFNGKLSSVSENKVWLATLHKRYSGMAFTCEDIIAEGNKVAVRWRLHIPSYKTYGPGWFIGTNIMTFDGDRLISNVQDDFSGKKRFWPANGDGPIDHV